MATRNESRATGAIAKLEAEGVLKERNGSVVWLKLDLLDPASVKASAEELMRRETRLDILGESNQKTHSPTQRELNATRFSEQRRSVSNASQAVLVFMKEGPYKLPTISHRGTSPDVFGSVAVGDGTQISKLMGTK